MNCKIAVHEDAVRFQHLCESFQNLSARWAINPQQDAVIQIPGSPIKLYQFYPKFPVSIIVQVAYTIVAVALSLAATNRKEMA